MYKVSDSLTISIPPTEYIEVFEEGTGERYKIPRSQPPPKKKIYLASPYSHEVPSIQESRFIMACVATGKLLKKGYLVYSPIAACHSIAAHTDLPKTFSFWEEYDTSFIQWCDEVWVLKLHDWEKSIGVKAEIAIAQLNNKLVRYINVLYTPNTEGNFELELDVE